MKKDDPENAVKEYLTGLIKARETDMATVSRKIGKNNTYLFAYFTKGSPKKLPEDVRDGLAEYFGVDADNFKSGNMSRAPGASINRSGPKNTLAIMEVDVRAGAGGGQIVDGDGNDVIGNWTLPAASFGGRVPNPANVRIIQIVGDSNIPDMNPGDRVMVDISDRRPSPPGFFALWDGMGLVVKRCEYIPNSDPARVRLTSSNKAYSSYELPLEECHINGRVIGKWQWT